MDKEMIEKITNMVLQQIESEKRPVINKANEKADSKVTVKIWDHLTPRKKDKDGTPILDNDPLFVSPIREEEPREEIEEPKRNILLKEPLKKQLLIESTKTTPARIGIGRVGVRPPTEALLRFRLDHAAAVDAVYGKVEKGIIEKLGFFSVNTKVTSKEEYIRRPDLGRKLSDEAKETLLKNCEKKAQVQIIVSDGLSSEAIEKNIEDVYLSLQQSLASLGLKHGTTFFIEKGRVAVMDDVGELLEPEVVVLLIGERPGLVSSESLSAYLCYKPRKGTIEADRMVVSNIHSFGIPPVEAGAYLGNVIKKVLTYQASGVNLVKKE